MAASKANAHLTGKERSVLRTRFHASTAPNARSWSKVPIPAFESLAESAFPIPGTSLNEGAPPEALAGEAAQPGFPHPCTVARCAAGAGEPTAARVAFSASDSAGALSWGSGPEAAGSSSLAGVDPDGSEAAGSIGVAAAGADVFASASAIGSDGMDSASAAGPLQGRAGLGASVAAFFLASSVPNLSRMRLASLSPSITVREYLSSETDSAVRNVSRNLKVESTMTRSMLDIRSSACPLPRGVFWR